MNTDLGGLGAISNDAQPVAQSSNSPIFSFGSDMDLADREHHRHL